MGLFDTSVSPRNENREYTNPDDFLTNAFVINVKLRVSCIKDMKLIMLAVIARAKSVVISCTSSYKRIYVVPVRKGSNRGTGIIVAYIQVWLPNTEERG